MLKGRDLVESRQDWISAQRECASKLRRIRQWYEAPVTNEQTSQPAVGAHVGLLPDQNTGSAGEF